ncbi:hypothetical protein GR160_02850 [Flavobacterium sp. Sd200]|uniref:hypothetical protein n=1 Tax=Flavobacterium sp. Sd200 TaxID=2692211 RepID=UPI00136DAC4F|nr:hypothetical protein [Flavobacterium sp. Sd200]MXN90152.1 hypothetical protein [Flavobacterium sp. Sd200]
MTIGTSIDGFIMLGGGGGAGSGLNSIKVTILADANNLQHAALVGATEIVTATCNGNTKNTDFDFTSAAGRLNAYDVYAGEVHTIFFKKP